MKVLYTITGFGMSTNIGGAACRTIEIAKHLAGWGNEINFLTTEAGKKAISRYNFKCNFYILKSSHIRKKEKTRIDRLLSYVVSIFDFAAKFRKLPKVDVVISNDDWFCDVIPAFIYKKFKKASKWIAYAHEPPVYIWLGRFLRARKKGHNVPFKDIIAHFVYIPFQEFSFLLFKISCDKIFMIGSESFLIKKHLKIKDSRIVQVGNGIDIKSVKNILPNKKKYDGCFLGGFRLSKGIFDLPLIWEEVVREKPDAKLIIIGAGSEAVKNKLEARIKKCNMQQHIELTGHVSDRNKIFEILKSSRIFVFPSHKEGWAIPITEAMACGLPTVVWEYPFYQQIYPKGIFYARLGDFQDFSDKINILLTNKELYQRASVEAQRTADVYDWDNVAQNEMKLLKGMLGK